MTLYVATTNAGKLREFRRGHEAIEPVPGMAAIPPPAETGATFEENAAGKALYYSRFVDGLVLADASGLEVDALGGAPGVISARYAGEGATDEDNNRRLLARLTGAADRTARFVCAIAVAAGGRLVTTARGAVEGRILEAPRGARGFGYDPLFYHEPSGCTFAELDGDRKWAVSHRGQALRALLGKLERE